MKRQKQNLTKEMAPNYACRKVFSEKLEKTLVDYVLSCSKMCYWQTVVNIRKLAYGMAIINNCKIPENWQIYEEDGRELFLGFMSRHAEFSLRQPEGCRLSRATSFYKHKVGLF